MRAGRDILGDYGPGAYKPQASRATTGGASVRQGNYSPPQGPTRLMSTNGPGLHGANAGNENKPTADDGAVGSPGNHGTNYGNCGTQGEY
jgi:hypothetical protein